MRKQSRISSISEALTWKCVHFGSALLLLVALSLLNSPVCVWAAPFAKNIEFTQPDKAQITLWGEGDEFHAVLETTTGYTVVFDPQQKGYYYADRSPDGNSLLSTGVPAHYQAPQGLAKHIRMNRDAAATAARARRSKHDIETGLSKRWSQLKSQRLGTLKAPDATAPSVQPAPPSSTTTGTKVGLTLLIDFPDAPATIPQSNIEAFLNGDSYTGYGNNGSVKQYFNDVSNGRLRYTNVVTLYVRMTKPKSYYNDTSVSTGTQGRLLINDALAILKARSDYTSAILPAFDALTTDASGNVVAFNVFYSGGDSGVWNYGLWPHAGGVSPVSLGNGVSVSRYQITNIGTSLELGTFSHENGHMLCGFPDLYDYAYDSTGGAGVFSLMGSGSHGTNPSQVDAYLKLAAGWATAVDLDSNQTGTLVAAPTNGYDTFYRYRNPKVPTEYFLLENRQKVGRDANLPAAGIAVWHVDELGDKDNQSMTPNSSHQNYELTLVQADNLWHFENDVNSGDAKDLYYLGNSAAGYTNRLDDASSPNAHWWDGSLSCLNLDTFSAAGVAMTFNYLLKTFAVTFAAGGNGSVVGVTGQTVSGGASTTAVIAVPSSGYHFVNWTGTGGFTATTTNPLTVANVTAAMTITANFAINPANVAACGNSDGVISAVTPTTFLCATGTASGVTGTGPWSWTCGSTDGSTAVSCKAYPQDKSQTGQTSCWDTSGVVIPCAGTGQDGALQMGLAWSTSRFIVNTDQTVTDSLTGLIWAKDGNLMKTRDPSFDADTTAQDGMVTWQHALDYIKKLNTENYQGYNDWRLPNINELKSLVNFQQSNSATWLKAQGFSSVQSSNYWSSTSASTKSYAWYVYLYTGSQNYGNKTGSSYVWPVRGKQTGAFGSKTGQTICYDTSGAAISCTGTGQDGELQAGVAWLNPRFTPNGDQTVTDNQTGLLWAKDSNLMTTRDPSFDADTTAKDGMVTWQHALDYIKKLNTENYQGHNDWRLPNINELSSLINTQQGNEATWLKAQGFSNVQTGSYWSSSTSVSSPGSAWYMYMYSGNLSYGNKTSSNYLWPVRGGQSGSYGSLTISKTGSGSVTASSGTISWSGATGTAGYPLNTSVTLTATPTGTGSIFAGWTGDCSGMSACTVTMGSVNVTATFTPVQTPINGVCGTAGSSTFTTAPTVNRCAVGISSVVTGIGPWSWTCQGSNGGTDASCSASLQSYIITFQSGGNGSVTGATSQTVNPGASTTVVTAVPANGYHFVNWTGTGGFITTTTNPLPVADVASNMTVTANFAIDPANPAVCGGSNGAILAVAPTTSLCTAGTASGVTGTGPWSWICASADGSTTASCRAYQQIKPLTSQSSCWDASGAVIPCTGTGQDGEMRMGLAWPNPRFTANSDQAITDNLTGLIWAKDGNLMTTRDPSFDADATAQDGMVTWQHALDYIKKLNTENYQGHNDWRLPNINELKSLTNFQQSNSATWLNTQGFSNVQSSYYWSSSTITGSTGSAGYVYLYTGFQSYDNKTYSNYVWPVRGGQPGSSASLITSRTGQTACYDTSGATINCAGTGQDGELQAGAAWPSSRFTLNTDQTLTDNLTGLLWAKDGNLMKARDPSFDADATTQDGMVTWQHALDYIKKLNTENYQSHNDWRLPNINELGSFINAQQSNVATWLKAQGFSNIQTGSYWSSSTSVSSSGSAWYVYMYSGYPSYGNKTGSNYVWPVRGGQSAGPIGSLTIVKTGNGAGVISTDRDTISWSGNTGTIGNPLNPSVTLTATPMDMGTIFTGWTGDCTSTGTCTVTLNAAKSVTATFNTSGTPINGVCGDSNGGTFISTTLLTKLCSIGTASGITGSGTWLWTCAGADGGSTATCSATIQTWAVSSGVTGGNGTVTCTTPVNNGTTATCTVTPASGYQLATFTDNGIDKKSSVADGSYTISNVTTAHSIAAAFSLILVNGACGTSNNGTFPAAPTTNLCSTGTASTVTGSGPWSWTCTGTAGGTTATCSAAIDKTGPTLTLSTLANGAITNNATLNISGTVADISGVTGLIINNTTVTITNGTFSHGVTLQAGANIITTIATDTLDNKTTDTRTITLDTSAPVLTISTPADNSKINKTSITVTGTVNETSTVSVNGSTAGVTMTGMDFSATVNLVSGLNTIDITVTDQAGNSTNAKRTVTSDTIAPSLAVTGPAQDITTAQNSITISGTVTDALTPVSISISVDGQTYTPTVTSGAFSQSITFSSEKTYTVAVTATDEAGNQTTVQRNIIYSKPVVSGAALTLGTVSGSKGKSVIVPVTLTNVTGTSLASVGMTIKFDTALLDSPSVSNGAAATAAGKSASGSLDSADPGAFTLLISAFNTTAIGDGVVANVTFPIKATAALGTTTLTSANTNGSDTTPNANSVVLTGVNGAIAIISKPGDCDGSGVVSVAEVQSAINMYLRLKPVAGCVDMDANGTVSVSEVQKAINAYLKLL